MALRGNDEDHDWSRYLEEQEESMCDHLTQEEMEKQLAAEYQRLIEENKFGV